MYADGTGVPQDYAEAVRWWLKVAEKGIAQGQSDLATMYAEGHGVPRDIAEAARLARKAAVQGYAPAQANLGMLYFNGHGVPKDFAEAVTFWLQMYSGSRTPMAWVFRGTTCWRTCGSTSPQHVFLRQTPLVMRPSIGATESPLK